MTIEEAIQRILRAHLVLILILSPQLYWRSNDTPEALFTRGEEAMQPLAIRGRARPRDAVRARVAHVASAVPTLGT